MPSGSKDGQSDCQCAERTDDGIDVWRKRQRMGVFFVTQCGCDNKRIVLTMQRPQRRGEDGG
jgi:hypothetical protein